MVARWVIINDIPMEDFGVDGRFTSVREITFQELVTGRTGQVKVAVRNYTPEAVASAIQPYADKILAMSQLGQG